MIRHLAALSLFAVLALAAAPGSAAEEDALLFTRSPLFGGFVLRVDAGPDRDVAYTTGGSFVKDAGAERWTRIDRPGADLDGPVRLVRGQLVTERDGVLRSRDDESGEWREGSKLGGSLVDVLACPGKGLPLLTVAFATAEDGGEAVMWCRGGTVPRRIGTVPGFGSTRIAADGTDPEHVLVAVQSYSPPFTHVFASGDAGAEWEHWTVPLRLADVAGVPGKADAFVAVSLPPAQTDGPLGLVRSDDGGRTWRAAGADPRLRELRALAVRPDSGAVLVGALDGAVLETPDLGETLTIRREGGGADQVTSIAVVPGRPDGIRIGTQAGIYRTENGGATWEWDVEGLTALQGTGLFAGAEGRVIVFDFHQGPRISVDGGRTFGPYSESFKRRYGRVYEVRAAGGTIVLDLAKSSADTTCLVTRDAGRTWARIPGSFAGCWLLGVLPDGTVAAADEARGALRLTEGLEWEPMPGVDDDLPDAPRALFRGPEGELVIQTARGLRVCGAEPRWIPDPPVERTPFDLQDPLLPGVFYATGGPGVLWRGRLDTGSWSRLGIVGMAWTSGIVADPERPRRRIASFNDGGLAVSEDEGISWRRFAEGRFEDVRRLAVGPDRRLWLLADGGLWSLPLSALDGD